MTGEVEDSSGDDEREAHGEIMRFGVKQHKEDFFGFSNLPVCVPKMQEPHAVTIMLS